MSLGNKMLNKSETIFEGWLVKSPPRKKFEKIWKLKWRRRWFALKQGELPGQFFLEYYTDSDCHKLKGQIDLDQCEQVDAGLRMLDKFQHMFDIKTPNRIYYLAAATEEDMRGWVKWICQVCGLQETRGPLTETEAQYFNIGPDIIQEMPLHSNISLTSMTSSDTNTTSRTETSILNNNLPSPGISLYQNTFGEFSSRGNGANKYSNRETVLISEAHKLNTALNNNNSINPYDRNIAEMYSNFSTIERTSFERSHSFKSKSPSYNSPGTSHSRTQSLDAQGATVKQARGCPENFRVNDSGSFTTCGKKASRVFNSSSGPYIPISECFSGGIYRVDNKQNSCNQYSPKSQGQNASDSESVFTDDEWTHPIMPHNTSLTRDKRRSETSLDKDHISWAHVQRYSRASTVAALPPPRPPKRISGIFSANSTENSMNKKESPLPSPLAIVGTTDLQGNANEESDNISQSQQTQHNYFNNYHHDSITPGFSPLDVMNVIASSTPNLIHKMQQGVEGSKTLPHSRQNFYTNTVPDKVEGNIFRYDFSEKGEAPIVNRKLKPKTISESSATSCGRIIKEPDFYTLGNPPKKHGPTVDRKLKPITSKSGMDKMRQSHGHSESMNITLPDEHTLNSMSDVSLLLNKSRDYPADRLQYLDLDHSNTPVKTNKVSTTKQSLPQGATSIGNLLGARGGDLIHSVAYTTVDFVKTDAFNRIREESNKQRMKK